MALKLNINRTYKHPVTVRYFNEAGQIQTANFVGIFNVRKLNDFEEGSDQRFIDLILAGVEGIEMTDEHGNALSGQELFDAVKNDLDLANACVEAYNESNEKKRTKPKTSEAQPASS